MKLNVDLQNHSYPIYIERNAIQKVHEYIPVSRKIALITDTGVPEKWVNTVKEQCPDSLYAQYHKESHPNASTNINIF